MKASSSAKAAAPKSQKIFSFTAGFMFHPSHAEAQSGNFISTSPLFSKNKALDREPPI
jgi:hypothetical protein